MESSLFIVAISCFLTSYNPTCKAVTCLNKIPTSAVQTTGYAPANVDGMSLEIGKPNVTKFYWECEFNVGNNHAHYSSQNAKYTKTGANTAKVEYTSRYEGNGVFNLKFTSPTGGIVIGKGVSFTLSKMNY